MSYVIAASRPGYHDIRHRIAKWSGKKVFLIDQKMGLTTNKLEKIKPEWIFLPHWSYLIPPEIFDNYKCVVFHMTDLPYGRGGTPLQNLIVRGFKKTKITALKCEKAIDGGPVYLKRSLSLNGTAEEIYQRSALIIEKMIKTIIKKNPLPVPQKGKAVIFRRRRPEDSNIHNIKSIQQLFDIIRMLDAKGYPKAYIENSYLRFEFKDASKKAGHLIATVDIRERK